LGRVLRAEGFGSSDDGVAKVHRGEGRGGEVVVGFDLRGGFASRELGAHAGPVADEGGIWAYLDGGRVGRLECGDEAFLLDAGLRCGRERPPEVAGRCLPGGVAAARGDGCGAAVGSHGWLA
jgi:hypothetical protein